MSYHACNSTERMPYSFDPGGQAIRQPPATSRWIMPTHWGTRSRCSNTLKKSAKRCCKGNFRSHAPVGKQRAQLHAQEIARHEPRRKFGIVGTEVVDALGVDLGAPHDDVARRSRNCVSTPMPHPTSNTGAGASAVPPDRASQILRAMFRSTRKMLAQSLFRPDFTHWQSFYGIRRHTARRRTAKVAIFPERAAAGERKTPRPFSRRSSKTRPSRIPDRSKSVFTRTEIRPEKPIFATSNFRRNAMNYRSAR